MQRWRDFLTQRLPGGGSHSILRRTPMKCVRPTKNLHARFQRLIEESRGGAGIFGAIGAIALNIAFSAIPGIGGPVLGAAVAAGFTTAANGGNLLETVIAMGVAAGGVYVSGEVAGAVAQAATEVGQVGSMLPNAAGGLASFGVEQAGEAVNAAVVHDQPVPHPAFHPQPGRTPFVAGIGDIADSGRVPAVTLDGVDGPAHQSRRRCAGDAGRDSSAAASMSPTRSRPSKQSRPPWRHWPGTSGCAASPTPANRF